MSTDTDATEAGPTGDDPGQHRRITMDPAAVDVPGRYPFSMPNSALCPE